MAYNEISVYASFAITRGNVLGGPFWGEEEMKRTRNKPNKPSGPADAVLVSDLHLTDATPVSRTDNYTEAQICKLQFLQSLSAKNNNCPILCAGDVFDHWKASPWLCSLAFTYLPRPFISIPGQHDLPGHSLKEFPRSALGLMEEVCDPEEFTIISLFGQAVVHKTPEGVKDLFILGVPFGELKAWEGRNPKFEFSPGYRYVLMLHELTWQGKRPHWDKNSWTDVELLDKFGEYFDLIITGDNHGGFATHQGGSWLVNPGSMMRRNADQAEYRPRCYLYYAEENELTPVYFPIEKGVHNREHLDVKKERDERIAAYIERMNQDWEVGLSFQRNLEAFFKENSTPRKVREIISCHLETGKT